jgi:hypothetical protein
MVGEEIIGIASSNAKGHGVSAVAFMRLTLFRLLGDEGPLREHLDERGETRVRDVVVATVAATRQRANDQRVQRRTAA